MPPRRRRCCPSATPNSRTGGVEVSPAGLRSVVGLRRSGRICPLRGTRRWTVLGLTRCRSRGDLRDRAGLVTRDATAANRRLEARKVAFCSVGGRASADTDGKALWRRQRNGCPLLRQPLRRTLLAGVGDRTSETRSCQPTRRSKLVSLALRPIILAPERLYAVRGQRDEATHSEANGIDCGASRLRRGTVPRGEPLALVRMRTRALRGSSGGRVTRPDPVHEAGRCAPA
jgi:hypothetical protein